MFPVSFFFSFFALHFQLFANAFCNSLNLFIRLAKSSHFCCVLWALIFKGHPRCVFLSQKFRAFLFEKKKNAKLQLRFLTKLANSIDTKAFNKEKLFFSTFKYRRGANLKQTRLILFCFCFVKFPSPYFSSRKNVTSSKFSFFKLKSFKLVKLIKKWCNISVIIFHMRGKREKPGWEKELSHEMPSTSLAICVEAYP